MDDSERAARRGDGPPPQKCKCILSISPFGWSVYIVRDDCPVHLGEPTIKGEHR